MPDGVFDLSGSGRARFVSLAAPTDDELDRILRRIIRRAARVVADAKAEYSEDALAELQAKEVNRGQRSAVALAHQHHSAMLDGFSLHAGVHLHGRDHEGREKLFRYILRPPLALRRLSMGEDGRLLYRMKRPRADGLLLSLTPDELLARLATLVPPPRTHGLRYHGVFAPNSKQRSRVVPPPPSPEAERAHCGSRIAPPKSPPAEGEATSKTEERKPDVERSYRVPWAELLQRVFAIDVLDCPKCSGRMKLIAFITGAGTARQILEHLELPTTGPPTAKAEPMGSDEPDPAPEYDVVDPSWEE